MMDKAILIIEGLKLVVRLGERLTAGEISENEFKEDMKPVQARLAKAESDWKSS